MCFVEFGLRLQFKHGNSEMDVNKQNNYKQIDGKAFKGGCKCYKTIISMTITSQKTILHKNWSNAKLSKQTHYLRLMSKLFLSYINGISKQSNLDKVFQCKTKHITFKCLALYNNKA